jgi:SEC-C motif-containing protein
MPTGRNDPCPCGSGKKYKKCHGATIEIAPVGVRACGECTACCDGWVAGVIEGHEMKPGTPCFFRGEGCCTIYERRPQHPCRNFVCGWLQTGSPFPDDWRPDQLGVMVITMKWRGREAYVLRSTSRDPDEKLLEWMREFSLRTGRPFFYEIAGERFGFGPAEFQREMSEKVARGEPLWGYSSK